MEFIAILQGNVMRIIVIAALISIGLAYQQISLMPENRLTIFCL